MPDYETEHKDALITFLTDLFKVLIGEGDSVSMCESSSSCRNTGTKVDDIHFDSE